MKEICWLGDLREEKNWKINEMLNIRGKNLKKILENNAHSIICGIQF